MEFSSPGLSKCPFLMRVGIRKTLAPLFRAFRNLQIFAHNRKMSIEINWWLVEAF